MSNEQSTPDTITTAARRFTIPGNVVNQATADLPDDQRSAVRWLHAHADQHDLTLGEIGALIRYDGSVVSRIFRGHYQGDIAAVCAEIEKFRDLHDKRSAGRKLAFIQTDLAKRIWQVCHAAREYQRIAFIFGDTQIGKSEALREYTRAHNHGSTIYVSAPTGGSLSAFLGALAKALRISTQNNERELRKRITAAFDDRMLLIVDEAHQCVNENASRACSRTIEFVRELFDATQCGVVICATNVFRDELSQGRFAGILKQTRRRRLVALQCPDRPTAKDLNIFAEAYKLPPAERDALTLQTNLIRDEGLGYWLTLLRMASRSATRNKTRMSWTAVLKANAGLRELEGGL